MAYLPPGKSTRSRQIGFTLVELMIVVAILGVLAAIAIPVFSGYVYEARTSEAITMLASIKQRQAAYYAEMGQYCDVAGDDDADGWHPPGDLTADGSLPWQSTESWRQLGAAPDTASVRFQYIVSAGPPSTTPSGVAGGDSRGYSGADFWFVSAARADLDGDGDFLRIESYSAISQVWISESKGWE